LFDVLPSKFKSPPYTAVIFDVPTGSAKVVKVAEPPVSDLVPSTVEPSIKVTLSLSGGAGVTIAAKVTSFP
jgi:hypothetical protein